MAVIKVVIEFEYDTNENIKNWDLGDCDIEQVEGLNDAIDVARAEINTHGAESLILKAYFEDSPDTAIEG